MSMWYCYKQNKFFVLLKDEVINKQRPTKILKRLRSIPKHLIYIADRIQLV